MVHFLDRFLANQAAEAIVAPIFAHLGMDEVLVDSRQLFEQDLVEHVNDFFVSLHCDTPFFSSACRLWKSARYWAAIRGWAFLFCRIRRSCQAPDCPGMKLGRRRIPAAKARFPSLGISSCHWESGLLHRPRFPRSCCCSQRGSGSTRPDR